MSGGLCRLLIEFFTELLDRFLDFTDFFSQVAAALFARRLVLQ